MHASEGRVRWLSDSQVRETGKTALRYSGKPGSIGIHDSRVVHGSYANRSSQDRLALSLRFDVVAEGPRANRV